MLIDVSRALRRRKLREDWVGCVRVRRNGTERTGWGLAIHRLVKGYGSVYGVAQVRGEGLHIKHSESAADRGFRIAEGIPGETDAGLKIAKSRIRVQRRTYDHSGIGQVLQACQTGTTFRQHGCHLIAQSQIRRQIGAYVHVVLQVNTEERLSNPAPGYHARRVCDKGHGLGGSGLVVGEKALERTELEVSTRLGGRGLIVNDALHVRAELQTVFTFGQKDVVVDLPRIPVILGRGLGAQPSREKRQAWYADKSYRISWDVSQTGVRGKRIDGLAPRRSGGIFAVVTQADGIHPRGPEAVVLFQANQLSPGLREDKFVVKFIIL